MIIVIIQMLYAKCIGCSLYFVWDISDRLVALKTDLGSCKRKAVNRRMWSTGANGNQQRNKPWKNNNKKRTHTQNNENIILMDTEMGYVRIRV